MYKFHPTSHVTSLFNVTKPRVLTAKSIAVLSFDFFWKSAPTNRIWIRLRRPPWNRECPLSNQCCRPLERDATIATIAIHGDERPFTEGEDHSPVDLSKHHQSCKPPPSTGPPCAQRYTDQTVDFFSLYLASSVSIRTYSAQVLL